MFINTAKLVVVVLVVLNYAVSFKISNVLGKISMNMPVTGDGRHCFVDFINCGADEARIQFVANCGVGGVSIANLAPFSLYCATLL